MSGTLPMLWVFLLLLESNVFMGSRVSAQEAGHMPWQLFVCPDPDRGFSTQLRTRGGRVLRFPGSTTKCTKGRCLSGGQRMRSGKILSLLSGLLIGGGGWAEEEAGDEGWLFTQHTGGLFCVPSKDVEALVPNTYQCDLICKEGIFAGEQVEIIIFLKILFIHS